MVFVKAKGKDTIDGCYGLCLLFQCTSLCEIPQNDQQPLASSLILPPPKKRAPNSMTPDVSIPSSASPQQPNSTFCISQAPNPQIRQGARRFRHIMRRIHTPRMDGCPVILKAQSLEDLLRQR